MRSPQLLIVAVLHVALLLRPSPAAAAQINVPAQKAQSISAAGGFAGYTDANNVYYQGEDIFGDLQFSVPIIFDTGASGNLMSQMTASTFLIPTTGQTYNDVGIGGTETFDVSSPVTLMLAPVAVGESGADDQANYQSFGSYKFQIKQSDDSGQGFDIPIDIVGMPVLKNRVMHVQPNTIDYSNYLTFQDYMRTELLPSSPTGLPSHGVFRIPLALQDFVDRSNGDPPVTVSQNPVIPAVRIVDSRRDAAHQSAPRDWLLDTGAAVTIIGRDYATEIGIDLLNESPVTSVDVVGVGGATRSLFGYVIEHLIIPLDNGDTLSFDNATVFVPEEGALPADLPGILGMNLIGQSYSELGLFGPLDVTDSRYSDFYVDLIANQLILVDPASDYVGTPEPGTMILLAIGSLALLRRAPRSTMAHRP